MIDPQLVSELEQINSKYREVFQDMVRVWSGGILFSWHWWVEFGLTVLPWALWLIIRDKRSTPRLLAAGFLTLMIASVLDMTGIYLGLWEYHSVLLPIVPAYLPWDWSVMPVTAMLFYQFKPGINPWIKAVIFSAVGAFAAEPFFAWLGIYNPIAWEFWYSFPIFIVVFMLGWALFRHSAKSKDKNAKIKCDS